MGKKEVKKAAKDFDVWVTRDHQSDQYSCDSSYDQIEVSNAHKTEVHCVAGCCLFARNTNNGYGRKISPATCLKRYDFLPRPGRCWNVWSVNGVLHHQEWPLTVDDTDKLYKKTGHAKTGHPGEKEFYFALTD